MKKRGMISAALPMAAILIFGLLVGCGSRAYESADYADDAADYQYEAYIGDGETSGVGYSAAYISEEDNAAESAEYNTGDTAEIPYTGDASGETEQKLIYTASVEAETTDYDKTVEKLAALTGELGGYYESSRQGSYGSGNRYVSITVRIPAENYRDFLERAGSLVHVLYSSEYTEDVSEVYYDVAGRLETQQTKLARLRELLEEAADMEDIIVIENEISETEEIIDMYTGQLRHYDALVDYSTVNISLDEVTEETPDEDHGFGGRMLTALSGGIQGFLGGLQAILIVLAYIWPWLLLAAGITVLIIALGKRLRPRREARRARRAEKKAARAAEREKKQEK